MNNEFKQFREIFENRNVSIIARGGVIASFNTGIRTIVIIYIIMNIAFCRSIIRGASRHVN
jgi:hypothetical protein